MLETRIQWLVFLSVQDVIPCFQSSFKSGTIGRDQQSGWCVLAESVHSGGGDSFWGEDEKAFKWPQDESVSFQPWSLCRFV